MGQISSINETLVGPDSKNVKVCKEKSGLPVPTELHGLIEFIAELMAEEYLKENGLCK